MSATLSVVNYFELVTQGLTFSGKQGLPASLPSDVFDITVTGTCHPIMGTLATAGAVTVYDDDDDVPTGFDYLFFWSDQICYLQLITASGSVVHRVAAYTPFVLPGYGTVLANTSTTPIAGGAEPATVDIDSVVIGNYSGTSMNYFFAVID